MPNFWRGGRHSEVFQESKDIKHGCWGFLAVLKTLESRVYSDGECHRLQAVANLTTGPKVPATPI